MSERSEETGLVGRVGALRRNDPALFRARALLTLILRADQRDRALEFVTATFEDDPIERARALDRIAANDLALVNAEAYRAAGCCTGTGNHVINIGGVGNVYTGTGADREHGFVHG